MNFLGCVETRRFEIFFQRIFLETSNELHKLTLNLKFNQNILLQFETDIFLYYSFTNFKQTRKIYSKSNLNLIQIFL